MAAAGRQIEIEVPELHVAQQQIVEGAKRFNVLACGRRFGKTKLGTTLIIDPILAGQPVAWFSPTYKMLQDVWRDVSRTLKPIASNFNEQQRRIETVTGGILDCWSLDAFDAVRGRKYARAVVDEAAMVPWLAEAWQHAIRPTLTDYKGDGWLLSTPKGLNHFFECFTRGQDESSEWKSWQMPTTANPFIDPAEVEAARRELPEDVFRQEYLAEFLSNQGAVFRNILACLCAQSTTPDAHKGHFIVGGIDWAQKADYTCCSVFCVTCKQELELDHYNKIDWQLQRGRVRSLNDKWGVKYWLAETNSIGSPNLEALVAEGLPAYGFETTQNSKHAMIQSLALAFERTEAQWLPDPVAKTELQAYEVTISKNGRPSYSAPEGLHDDTVIGRGLAWYAATTYGVGVQHGDKLW